MSDYKMGLETDFGGILLELDITTYNPDRPANLTGHPDNWTPPEPGDLEYEIVKASPSERFADIELKQLPPGTDHEEYINTLECYIKLTERCVDFEPSDAEDEEILEFLSKAIDAYNRQCQEDADLAKAGY